MSDHLSAAAAVAPQRVPTARRRRGDGLDIRLLWNPADDTVTVTVADVRTEELFIVPVAAHEALDGFQHPFRYAGAPVDRPIALAGSA